MPISNATQAGVNQIAASANELPSFKRGGRKGRHHGRRSKRK